MCSRDMGCSKEVLILGAGLTGMSAATSLRERALVLERSDRPGGLVKTEDMNGYWFDHVVHLLHFKDMKDLELRIRNMMPDELQPMQPEAWVETREGISKYPLQMHLSGLNKLAIVRTIKDLVEVTYSKATKKPTNYKEFLTMTFGKYFCELFMFPYNRKVWKRPLSQLMPSGFQWNIDHPDLERVLLGAMTDHEEFNTYNSNAWYPVPPVGAPCRGMECMSIALSKQVDDIRYEHEVIKLDLNTRIVTVMHEGEKKEFEYRDHCLSTIPLPKLMDLTVGLPEHLRGAQEQLVYNRVLTVMLSIKGPRPENRGHWRYYSQEELCFTRLIYMHNFDPYSAPEDGWGVMAEITEPAEWPLRDKEEIMQEVIADFSKAGALPDNCEVIDTNLLVIDPAYVVFTEQSMQLVEELKAFYDSHNIKILGRYGQWEYSSMAKVMNDGYAWAESISQVWATV